MQQTSCGRYASRARDVPALGQGRDLPKRHPAREAPLQELDVCRGAESAQLVAQLVRGYQAARRVAQQGAQAVEQVTQQRVSKDEGTKGRLVLGGTHVLFVTRLRTLQVILRRLFEQAGGRGAGVEEREDPREGVVKVAIKLLEAYTEHVPPPVCTCRHNAHVTEAYCGAK